MPVPAVPSPAPRRDLDALVAHHRLPAAAVAVLLDLAAARPTAAEDRRFLRRALGLAGVVSLFAGVVFFVAANWAAMGPAGRFALLQGLLLVAGAAALVRPPPDRVGALALLAAFLLTGALLALFGQTYQTGADVYELFLAWAGLGLPLVAVAGASAAWGAWVLVVNVALGLLLGLPPGNVLWSLLVPWHVSSPVLFALATLVDVALWTAFQAAVGTRLAAVSSPWLQRLAIAAAGGFAASGAVLGILGGGGSSSRQPWAGTGTRALAVALLAAAAWVGWSTLRRRRDVFPLAAIAAVVIAAGTTALLQASDLARGAEEALFLLTGWLVVSSAAAGWVLMTLLRRWRAAGTLA